MRSTVVASALGLLALVALIGAPGPAGAAKSKMGCEIGTEVWNAGAGKCQPGTPKYKKAPEKSATADAPPAKKKGKAKAKTKAPDGK